MGKKQAPPLPGIFLRSIAGGMILMAIFSCAWVHVALLGSPDKHSAWLWLATALIIGLHFYPMAKLFNRTIDYYIATGFGILRSRPTPS